MITDRQKQLKALLEQRILVLDGATGTSLQEIELTAEDFGGPALEGCNENLVVTRPDVVEAVHRGFLEAGADIIETNTFGSSSVVLEEYELADRARELSRLGSEIARKAADQASTSGQTRFVAGSMGPTTRALSVTGGISWEELAASYQEQAAGLLEGGSDFLLVETCQDTLNIKAALEGIDRAEKELGVEALVAVQGTVETMGTLLAGQDVEALYVSLEHRELLWMGLNCATGPDFMTDHLRTLADISRFPVACIPNAGLPDEEGNYNEDPERLAGKLRQFAEQGWLNVVGGCCGTVPEHVRAIAEAVKDCSPRKAAPRLRSVVSGIEACEISDEKRPVLVGERTNVLGSRRFKRLIAERKFEEAAEVGRGQVRRGAAIMDVCLQDPDGDELNDLPVFLELLVKKIKVPIMVDTTDVEVLEAVLPVLQGKCVINSINLEDGEEKFEQVVPLLRRFGGAAVVGCIDEDPEQAQAVTRERKLEVARNSSVLLTEKYGLPIEDIFIDPLVFPVGTGDRNYVGSGIETIEGIRLIKRDLPGCKTILGISNVSFGLPTAGREVLNSVFLHHCVEAGLDMAIVSTESLAPYSRIPHEERRLCDDLLEDRGDDPIAAFAAHFKDVQPVVSEDDRAALSAEERISLCVLEGSKQGLEESLEEFRQGKEALDVINGPLMAGMDEVGKRFSANEMIVAEVLQSAEAMKAGVGYLEQFMDKNTTASRGRILLATVKGDVHDIGKNLVDIILSNNGFEIINLGIRVPPEDLLAACREHSPDLIGLSGLLVKSARQMVTTATDLAAAGVDVPLLVGGAALSNRFTRLKIAPEYPGPVVYARDAMLGLELAGRLRNEDELPRLVSELEAERQQLEESEQRSAARRRSEGDREYAPPKLAPPGELPRAPDYRLHVERDRDPAELFDWINPAMLYGRHLGFKGNFANALAAGDAKAIELRSEVEKVQDWTCSLEDVAASAVYRFFSARGDGESLVVYPSGPQSESSTFVFGRQQRDGGLCLSDYVSPGGDDNIAMFVTSFGPGVRGHADKLIKDGEFLKAHIFQALALETAEAYAEFLHSRLRAAWGFADPAELSRADLFKARYHGKRYSFGYPACPRLEDQSLLFEFLEVSASLGVELTEGFMMEPESSVSAVVFHHPEASYFSLNEADSELLNRNLGEPPPGA